MIILIPCTYVFRNIIDGFTVISSTSYYVTFELENGGRMELSVKGSEYGMLVEGDTGALSYQGTRYLGFERR